MVGQGTVRVLVVDANPGDAELFAETLSRLPFHSVVIEAALSGGEGLAKARRSRYDLVFLDYSLPGSGGPGLLKALQEENLSEVVVLAGQEDAGAAVEALKLGALDYVIKEDAPRLDLGRLIERALELMRLKRTNYELERLNVMKNEFLTSVSRELSAPVTLISGLASLLLSGSIGAMNDEQKRLLGQLKEQGEKLIRLNQEFLELRSRTLSSQWLDVHPLALSELVRAASSRLAGKAGAKGVSLALEAASEPFSLEGDAAKLADAVARVVDNAIRFTPPGGRIAIRLQRVSPGEVELSVEDTGEGIETEKLPKVFDQAYIPGSKGSGDAPGASLAFCREVAEAHHGRLRVDSPGRAKGTRVSFILPCPTRGRTAPAPDARKVLLVDDNRDVIELLRFLLRRCGGGPLEFLTASTGERAIELASQDRLSLIVLDVMLSGMDGLEVLEALKKSAHSRGVPVLIMTAFPDVANRALALGAGSILIKPFSPDRLLREVRSLLEPAAAAPGP